MPTVQERLQSIISKANQTTGKTDADVTAATQSLIDGFGGGGEYVLSRDAENIGYAWSGYDFGGIPEAHIYAKRLKNMGSAFSSAKNLKKLVIHDIGAAQCNGTFNNFSGIDTLEFTNGIAPKTAGSLFRGCDVKKIIGQIDLTEASKAGAIKNAFDSTKNLSEVNLAPNSIYDNFGYLYCKNLPNEVVQVTIDALADLKDSPSKAIQFEPDVKARMTPEQKAQITSKNWNLV